MVWGVVLVLAAIDADLHHAEPPELLTLLHTLGTRFTRARPPGDRTSIRGRPDGGLSR